MFEEAKDAVVRVGDGRGFIVGGEHDRFIITAAHCLSNFPPCASFSGAEVRSYASLLGTLNSAPKVWATCLFLDPIGDIAVLGEPDGQILPEEWEGYDAMVEQALPLSVSDAPLELLAWLLSLDGRWFQCSAKRFSDVGPFWISDPAEEISGGMSGSPILAKSGSAVGVVCTASSKNGGPHHQGGPQPCLSCNLPGWLLRKLGLTRTHKTMAASAKVRSAKAMAKKRG